MHRQQVSRQEAEDIIERVDRMREDYIRRYTGTTRYDTRNYDLVINMDGMTEEKAVKVICEYIND
jgi:cytidylate kinase